MQICVVGVGYVGLVTGTCFAEFGNTVVCVDNDPKKIDMLNNDGVPIYEPGLEEMVAKNRRENRLQFTTDLKEGLKDALVVFIAVGTPEGENGEADLKYVWQVAQSIGETMDDYKVVVTKSTVPVGTGKRVQEIISEHQKETH
jgi:UDPglucose 6-dehydrogenase